MAAPPVKWTGPGFGWGLSCAEFACVTDFWGPNLLAVLHWAKLRIRTHPTLAPLGSPIPAGSPIPGGAFLRPPNGLRGSHCGTAAFEALSCGRDRVRWRSRWLGLGQRRSAVRAGRAGRHRGAAGSLVLRRMDRRGHKRDLVPAEKHGTKSGSGAPLRRDLFLVCPPRFKGVV